MWLKEMSFTRYSHCPRCDNFLIIESNHLKTCPVCELQKDNKQISKMKKTVKSEIQIIS
ncbi:hypothetical protein LCGC14_1882530 [marine sediment metagenome]|uniref:Uncharacterized protein n=1 Tax=marine sediment metagenome TaxID=412755 RepID=A0A0F9GQ48_9ZZZZ